MTEPKACFFVGNYRPEVFGIGRYIPHYVDALAAAGWTAEVFAPFPFYPAWRPDRTEPRESQEAGGRVRIHRYAPFVPRHPVGAARALHDLSLGWHAIRSLYARAGPADLFVAPSPPLLGGAVTVHLARRRRRPSLVLAYDLVGDLASDTMGPVAGWSARALQAIEARMYADATHVIGLTGEMASRIETMSARADAVSVLRIWADDGLFSLDRDAAAIRFRAEQGMNPGTRLIGFAGNFGRKQQLSAIAEAAWQLSEHVRVVFIGDGPYRSDLERIAAAHPERIRVLPPVSETDLHGFLAACDAAIVVAWTRHDGSLFPSKAANVLAAGCPIIAVASPDSELARLVAGEALGVACPSLAPDELAVALSRGAELGRDPAQRARCHRYAQLHLRRQTTMDRFLSEAERLIA